MYSITMTYVLVLVLSFLIILGLFFIFTRKVIIWGSYKFAGKEQTEKTITFLQTPLGKTFLWRQRVKGIFYILLFFYVVIGITDPKIFKYFPWYVLAIPLALSLALTIVMTVFSYKQKGQTKEITKTINPEENNRHFHWARTAYVLSLCAILIYAGILYGSSGAHFISERNSFLGVITVIVIVIGIYCLFLGFSLPSLMTRGNKPNPIRIRKWLLFSSNYVGTEGRVITIYILRAAMFAAISVYGLTLGILGVGWVISAPFFVVSAVALIITFPTQKRWNSMVYKFINNFSPSNPE